MDGGTATIIAAVLALVGTIAAAVIHARKKTEVQNQVVEKESQEQMEINLHVHNVNSQPQPIPAVVPVPATKGKGTSPSRQVHQTTGQPRAKFSDLKSALDAAGITRNRDLIGDLANALGATWFTANGSAQYLNMYRNTGDSRAVVCVYATSCDSMTETDRDYAFSQLASSYPNMEAKTAGTNGYGLKFNQ